MEWLPPVIAQLGLALSLGAITFFSAVMAPLVFTRLPGPVAGGFIRSVFPYYYLFIIVTSVMAALGLLGLWRVGALVMAGVAGLGVYARQALMPRINALRDEQLGGNVAAGRAFEARHRLSVGINVVQWLACLAITALVAV